ncbi:MAG: HPr family phosphocarrier protein [Oscillospiraceae bacterium]|jgi:phosphotransferase system HPr (HPr) family protein|nr:HPr family phosphocarrier protein [Oscillospiraceae bacterium]
MIRKDYTLTGLERLQTKMASLLVQEACKHTARVLIEQQGKTVNAKSMMGVLSLGVPMGKTLTLVIEGEDEQKAARALEPLMHALYAQG